MAVRTGGKVMSDGSTARKLFQAVDTWINLYESGAEYHQHADEYDAMVAVIHEAEEANRAGDLDGEESKVVHAVYLSFCSDRGTETLIRRWTTGMREDVFKSFGTDI
tara:strand:- start:7642 stop:7962 length:321 start_codon:yes stop_codon:yes gene_type:complete